MRINADTNVYNYSNLLKKKAESEKFAQALKENEKETDKKTEEKKDTEKKEAESSSDIIVRPDGSRILVMNMMVGGMQSSMSIEISKPTDFPNQKANDDTDDTAQDCIKGEIDINDRN